MLQPTIVSPAEFVSSLKKLITSDPNHKTEWAVTLESNMMPETFKVVPHGGVPEALVREHCKKLMMQFHPATPIGLHDL